MPTFFCFLIAQKWKTGLRSYDDFSADFHLERPAIRRYLKQACNINLIPLSYETLLQEIRIASNSKLAKSKGQAVMCNETGEVFYSIAQAQRIMHVNNINLFFKGERNSAGKLPDGTPLTWTKLNT